MKAKAILCLLSLALGAALTSAVRAADITPVETRAIAEEGFIYGLPIVMNYAVMYEYAVDRDSGQFKAPFNQINNEARVFTYKDTAIITPNSDTPYSVLWADLRAEPIVLSIPEVEKSRYYSVMLCDGNTYNYGFPILHRIQHHQAKNNETKVYPYRLVTAESGRGDVRRPAGASPGNHRRAWFAQRHHDH
jgi:hypothetical protein